MKKLITLVLVFVLLLPASVVSAKGLKPDANIDVLLEGEKLFFDVDPIQTQGTTFVQFTTIFKALGLQYEWLPATKEVHGYNSEIDLWLTLNDNIAVLNGELIELPVAPFAYDGRTLVPLRFVSQSTGLQVDWDGPNKLIEIYNKNGSPTAVAPKDPDISDYVGGFSKGPAKSTVMKYMDSSFPLETDYSEWSIQYDRVDFLGYYTQVFFNFSEDELYGASYYYGRYGEKESTFIDVYNDIVGNLELQFGKPKLSEVRTAWFEGVETEKVTKQLSDSELLKGLKNEEYEVFTEWDFKSSTISVVLYLTESGGLNIETSFSYK